jgi:trimethylamine---corrinoid protein Co-methyltransferase
MHLAGNNYPVCTPAQIELIHSSALRILSEMGFEIQNRDLLEAFAEAGLPVDFQSQRVRFPPAAVERYIADAEKYDWEHHKPAVHSSAGVYECLYHSPETFETLPWTEERLAFYFKLARRMPHVGTASMLGSRIPGPAQLEPLYERYFCWKYGAEEGSSIFHDEICPFLYELYQMRAASLNLALQDVFRGTVYLVPALRLGQHEAYQVAYFRQRGLRVGVGDMYAMGATAPVTLDGAVTLNLAEQLALHIFNRVLFDDRSLHLNCSLAPIDMRTMHHTFGRPEMTAANILSVQLARFYGASFSGHAALTDAKFPSEEAGAQKAMSAGITLLAGGSLWVDAGLLANDEIVSPIQLILDNELIGALQCFTQEREITPETIGLETIFETGPGGMYLDKHHTARHFRTDLWQPSVWTRTPLGPWREAGSKLDSERARELAIAFSREAPDPVTLDPAADQEILALIHRAQEKLVS